MTASPIPGSGSLTTQQRELVARSLTLAGIDAGTLMVKVLRPGAVSRYLGREISPGVWGRQPPFDYRMVGGSVSRHQDTTQLASPADFVSAFGLGYPGSPFGTNPASVQTMEFPAVNVDRFVLPLGAPTLPYPAIGYPPNQADVQVAALDMVDAARRAGLDPNLVRKELNPWPFTGTGITADANLGFPEFWMQFSQIPASAVIFDHNTGRKAPVAVYRGAVLGWELVR